VAILGANHLEGVEKELRAFNESFAALGGEGWVLQNNGRTTVKLMLVKQCYKLAICSWFIYTTRTNVIWGMADPIASRTLWDLTNFTSHNKVDFTSLDWLLSLENRDFTNGYL
jgi:hypothetical protein